MSPEEFRQYGHQLIDWLADHQAGVASGRVQPTTQPGDVRALLPPSPPAEPEAFASVIADLDRVVRPHLTYWQHPRFFGYFPSNALPAGVLGDLVSTGLGVLGLSWQSSPALTEIEEVVLDWMRQILGLPPGFSGVISDTASTSTLVALICARERMSAYGFAREGLQSGEPPLLVYTSASSHSSVEKAALLAGYGRSHLRYVDVDDLQAMSPDALEAMIAADAAKGLRPCAVVAAVGGTATASFDPIRPIARIAKARGLWLHLDAAMAGSAMILPEMRRLWDGVEDADSLVLNAHKWLGAPFDCSLYFVQDEAHLVRVMSTNPSFLQSSVDGQVRNLRDCGIPLGRRFRALKLWFLLREQGVEGLQRRLRRDLENARALAAMAEARPGWRVVFPVQLQTVCLRYEPPGLDGEALDAFTRAWAEAVNASGEAYVTPAFVAGRWLVRVSVGVWTTEISDVHAGFEIMTRIAARTLDALTQS